MNHFQHSILTRTFQFIPLLLVSVVIGTAQTSTHGVTLRQDAFLTEDEGRKELANFAETYSNKVEWENRAENIRQNILIGAELAPLPEKTPLRPIMHSKRTYQGYTVENVAFESMPGFFVTGNLYRPTKKLESYAAILCPHGHFFPTDDDPGGRMRKDMQLRCAALARMGAIVFAYDMVGWGESTQFDHYQFPMSHDSLKKELKYQLWNSIRTVDFLLTLKGVDPKRIGVTGASGGGTQTFLLAAVDRRIAVSVPVVMVACHFFGGCICESGMPIHQSPRHLTNNCEIAALFAPKPMLVISDTSDWTRTVPTLEFPYIKHVYALYGAENNVENVHLFEGHDYGPSKRAPAYRFLAKHLNLDLSSILNDRGEIDESFVTIEKKEQMLVFTPQHPRPPYAIKAIDKLE
jgi:dienelactone hydrolase